MKKALAKHKMHRRHYKRFAAALAGTAIMAGTTLSGIPLAKAAAAEKPFMPPPVITEQTASTDKNIENPVTDPAVNQDKQDKDTDLRHNERDRDRYDNRERHRYDHERWMNRHYPFHMRIAWYNDSLNKIQLYNNAASPIDIVKTAAPTLGFDPDNDSFILISQDVSQSVVRVTHNGNSYDITIEALGNGNWLISLVNQVS